VNHDDETECSFLYGYTWPRLITIAVLSFLGWAVGCLLFVAFIVYVKAPFIRIHGIPVPRIGFVILFGVCLVMLTGFVVYLLVNCLFEALARGRLYFTAEAIALPDNGGKEQLIPFAAVTAIAVQGFEESLGPPFLQADPARHLHIFIQTADGSYSVWKRLLPAAQAFDQVLRTLTRECPRANFSIPGLNEPASTYPPGFVVAARRAPGFGLPDSIRAKLAAAEQAAVVASEKRGQTAYAASGSEAVDLAHEMLAARRHEQVEIRPTQPRPLTSVGSLPTTSDELGQIVATWRPASRSARIAWWVISFSLVTGLLVAGLCLGNFILMLLGLGLGMGTVLDIWCQERTVFRCHEFGISQRGPLRTRCLLFQHVARLIITRKEAQKEHRAGTIVALTVYFVVRPGLGLKTMVHALGNDKSLTSFRRALEQWAE